MEKYDRCTLIRNRDNIVTSELSNMVIKLVNNRSSVASKIVGATTIDQMKDNIQWFELKLSAAVLTAIETIHRQHPKPCP